MKDIARIIKKYDSELEYISGYEDCYSIVKCKCNRCENTFERRWTNLARNNTEYRCPICQDKLAKRKQVETQKETGYHLPHKSIDIREKEFIQRLNNKYPTFEYISGYEHSDKDVILKCKKCGDIFTRKAQCIRGKRNLTCFKCSGEITKQNVKAKNMLKLQTKYINKIKLNKRKEIQKIYTELKKNTLYIQVCNKCNNEFIEHSVSSYCPLCRKQIRHKHSGKSLKKLYERDNGICHICSEICNWNDKKEVNGTIIVGNTYPSIDHIIPLAKGGTDDWNNLGLAHMRCNTIKRDTEGYVSI